MLHTYRRRYLRIAHCTDAAELPSSAPRGLMAGVRRAFSSVSRGQDWKGHPEKNNAWARPRVVTPHCTSSYHCETWVINHVAQWAGEFANWCGVDRLICCDLISLKTEQDSLWKWFHIHLNSHLRDISLHVTCRVRLSQNLSHLLPQSEALQGDILPHQSSGVGEPDPEVSWVSPDWTWVKERQVMTGRHRIL